MELYSLGTIVVSRQKTKATSKRHIGDGFKAADGVALLLAVAIDVGLEVSLTWSLTQFCATRTPLRLTNSKSPSLRGFFVPEIYSR